MSGPAGLSSVVYYPGYSQVSVSWTPQVRTIQSISNQTNMVVTTTVAHGYQPGQQVRFLIPPEFGMNILNEILAYIMAVTSITFTTNIDSTNFSIFSYPSPLPQAYSNPSVIPNSSGQPIMPPLPGANQNQFGDAFRNYYVEGVPPLG